MFAAIAAIYYSDYDVLASIGSLEIGDITTLETP